MPRKQKNANQKEINVSRGENYQSHYECRRFALACDDSLRRRVADALLGLPRPTMNVFGAVPMSYYSPGMWDDLMQLSTILQIEVEFLVWWYWSEEGWNAFQKDFKDLPELYTAPVEKSPFVHRPGSLEVVHRLRR